MPRTGKIGNKKNAYVSLSDVKLSDYADNSSVFTVRKKSVISGTKGIHDLYALEKALLEQEAEEIENSNSDNNDTHCESSSHNNKKKSLRHAKATKTKSEVCGTVYPLDLWFCIGNYINPEDVKVFAQICKGSYIASQTYSFWMNLYKRNYQAEKQLPLNLQPRCIEKPWCLKARVIRALYNFYPKFIDVRPSCPEHWKLHKLMKNVCVSMWHLKGTGNEWLFYFKFQSRFSNHRSEAILPEDPPNNWMDWAENNNKDPLRLIEEVNHNPEEDYTVLQVQSPSFVAAPFVMGGSLADVKMGLTRDLTKQKLQLTFCFSNYKQSYKRSLSVGSRNCGGNAEVVAFDPVGSVTILDWWHPRYPLSNLSL